jgi:hypothetical protein
LDFFIDDRSKIHARFPSGRRVPFPIHRLAG